MVETTCTFGPSGILKGVFTHPENSSVETGKPGVLLLNAGLVYHVGPFRMNVTLARRLAEAGFTVLRFDLSGIGDSDSRRDARSGKELAVLDIKDAMDFFSCMNSGITTFVLAGLCSGADNAHATAITDTRITGCISLDGFTYPTAGFYLRDYLPYIVSPRRWVKFAAKRLQRLFSKDTAEKTVAELNRSAFSRPFPPQKQVEAEIRGLVNRGVDLLYIYSGGIPGMYNYANQFRDMFSSIDFRDNVELEYFGNADHTFSQCSERAKLIDCIYAWMAKRYSAL